MQTDHFLNQNGKVYYFGNDGKEYRDRFYNNWGHTYYFGADGARYTNQWSPDKKYYFGPDGAAFVGQHEIDDGDYHFDADGRFVWAQGIPQVNVASTIKESK